ncbi:hypothetical protein [Sphingomonas bacterium]|uniref:hypothetical protein n=1 Tax=Sphingomonas bacterium TaxID=1895847 RepID=UPI0015753974|nr:hypothetical protein [Sphingomonas bacterium]
MSRSSDTVSADGRTLTSAFSSADNAAGTPIEIHMVATRVARGPAGGHAVSGAWRQQAVRDVSAPARLLTFKEAGDRFTLTTGTGESYTATYGGPAVPMVGDFGGTMVSV